MKSFPQKTKASPLHVRPWRGLAAGLLALAFASNGLGQTVTQSIPLHAGWNAVWVEVSPAEPSPDTVFAGLPIESAWALLDKSTGADFIRDQNELPWNNASWRRWFPTNSPQAVLTTLFAVQPSQAYLLKLNADATLHLTGTPVVPRMSWKPDRFHLFGFPVDPEVPPTFRAFFGDNPAHAELLIFRLPAGGQWTQVSSEDRLASGEAYWVYCRGASDFVAPLELELGLGNEPESTVDPSSSLGGPSAPKARSQSRLPHLQYGPRLKELNLRLRNRSSQNRCVALEPLGAELIPVAAYTRPANGLANWLDLRDFEWDCLSPGTYRRWRLGIQRTRMTGDDYAGVMTVRDFMGTRYWVGVTANRESEAVAAGMHSRSGPPALNRAGLWVGNVTLVGVSQMAPLTVTTSGGDTNRPAVGAFQLAGPDNDFAIVARADGNAWNGLRITLSPFTATNQHGVIAVYEPLDQRLLIRFESGAVTTSNLIAALNSLGTNGFKDHYMAQAADTETNSSGTVMGVTQTMAPNGEGSAFPLRLIVHVATNGNVNLLKEVYELWQPQTSDSGASGQYVLLTNLSRLNDTDYQGSSLRDGTLAGRRLCSVGFDFPNSILPLGQNLQPGSSLGASYTVTPENPTNPFYHRRHPDHGPDHLFQGKILRFEIGRSIELQILDAPVVTTNVLDYGANLLDGVYTETLTGLHRAPITVQGVVRLNRVSSVSTLN